MIELPPFIPRKPIKYKPRAPFVPAEPTPPGAPLVLVSADYDAESRVLVVVFDRAVNLAAFDGAAVTLRDADYNNDAYDGTAAPPVLDAPDVVRVFLNRTGPYFSSGVEMSAGAGTGIVAVDDGGTWAGTDGSLALPWP